MTRGRKEEINTIEWKRATRSMSTFMLNSGLVEIPDECEQCGSKTRLVAHHRDYTCPYDVDFICHKCHGVAHSGNNRRSNGRGRITPTDKKQIGIWVSDGLWEKIDAKLKKKRESDPFFTLSKFLRQLLENAVE